MSSSGAVLLPISPFYWPCTVTVSLESSRTSSPLSVSSPTIVRPWVTLKVLCLCDSFFCVVWDWKWLTTFLLGIDSCLWSLADLKGIPRDCCFPCRMQLRGANSPEAMGCALEERGHSLCTGTTVQPVKSLFVMQRKEKKCPLLLLWGYHQHICQSSPKDISI